MNEIAENIVKGIISDLTDRRGLRQEWDGIDDEIKAEMKAAGLQQTCRKKLKNDGYDTQFAADEHFRVKHPRRWAAYQRFVTQNAQRQTTASMASAVQAMSDMALRAAGAAQTAPAD